MHCTLTPFDIVYITVYQGVASRGIHFNHAISYLLDPTLYGPTFSLQCPHTLYNYINAMGLTICTLQDFLCALER